MHRPVSPPEDPLAAVTARAARARYTELQLSTTPLTVEVALAKAEVCDEIARLSASPADSDYYALAAKAHRDFAAQLTAARAAAPSPL